MGNNHGGARKGAGRPSSGLSKDQHNKKHNHKYRIVYLLTNGYVGSTNNLHLRLAKHKSVGINPVEDVVILFASYDKKEANRVERFYHSIGYKGGRGHSASN